ncbi:MAG: hypothetical protein H0W74_12540 [Sphingosinicella sp.]|nr:hypothetical protein [Sphingosinicella sp.]
MAVKLTSGGKPLFPLTSPPPKPIPAPEPKLIAKVVSYEDREIIVTVPFPDSIELVAGVTNDILLVPDISGKSAKQLYTELDQEIQDALVEIAMNLPPYISGKVNPNNPTRGEFYIAYDDAQPLSKARVTLSRTKGADYASWRIRCEFSPSKAGQTGLVKLTAGLEAVLPFVSIPKLIHAFEVARIDSAIDCIGATPLDLIAHVPKPGKRVVYVGAHGKPESVYFYELKKPLKTPPTRLSVLTRGPHRLTLYERRDYHLQLSLQPPYGPCPVTRAEVIKRWTKKRPLLAGVTSLDNLFAGRRVAYAAAVPAGGSKAWRQFCLAAFGGGIDKSLFSWLPGPGATFAKAYTACTGDLIDPHCWDRWEDGIKATGLGKWAELAQSGQ